MTTTEAPTKPKPHRFSHHDIVTLVGVAAKAPRPEDILANACAALDGAPADAVEAKLIELNLIAKPARLTLTTDERVRIDKVVHSLATATEDPEKRILFVRHAIKALRTFLPTRAKEPKADA